jgi:hypothetical protein
MTMIITRDKTEIVPCTWLIERRHARYCQVPFEAECGYCEENAIEQVDCGAGMYVLRDQATGQRVGWECADGHQHVSAQVRFEQGWEYADGDGEADRLARAGVQPVPMAYAAPAVDQDDDPFGEPPF